MEELTWKEKVVAYLKEKAKAAPKVILITVVISLVLFVFYFVAITLLNVSHMM